MVERLLALSPKQHHPRYVGHQVSATIPRAALGALVGAVLNNGMAAFESGPAASMMERRVIDWMTRAIGFESGGGVLTSGGSLGNLTALLAARQARAPETRDRGLAHGEPLCILASTEVHYSIERAAQIMGLGREAVVAVQSDARYRAVPSDVHRAVADARRRGLRPIALCASAGATGAGAMDPLDELADVCARTGLWFHVDGAHGASALLSPRYRALTQGIARADSVVWDAHKLMSIPAPATGVLFRRAADAYETFTQDAAYLFRGEPRWFDVGLRTVECTKPLIAVPLYGCLATLGERPFRAAVEHGFDLAREVAREVRAADDLELACDPDTNIVCFRVLRRGEPLDDLQRRLLAEVRARGTFYLVMTTLRGEAFLRMSLMNPFTTIDDVRALFALLRSIT